MRKTTIVISEEMHKKVRLYAAEEEITFSKAVDDALVYYFTEEEIAKNRKAAKK